MKTRNKFVGGYLIFSWGMAFAFWNLYLIGFLLIITGLVALKETGAV